MSVTLRQFSNWLTESGLMTADEVSAFLESLPSDKRPNDGAELARELVRRKRLTKYQAQALYQGKTRGLVLGSYVVLEKLGRGGMGQVYKARHKLMKRVVALKVLPAPAAKSQQAIRRFRREVEAAAKLDHPNIVTAHDAAEAHGVHFLVMECVEGQDLWSVVRSVGRLPVGRAIDYTIQAAKGLEYAHGQGVIHRDIKPSNLVLDSRGTVKVLDMGLARINEAVGPTDSTPEESLTGTGKAMGTVDYMPPEQAENTKFVDGRADIYSLGCTLYHLLTGHVVYKRDTVVSTLLAHQQDPVPSLFDERGDIPEKLDAVVQKMIAKSPEDRYETMTAVINELEACRQALYDQVEPTESLESVPPVDRTVQETVPNETEETPGDESLPLELPVVSPLDHFRRMHPGRDNRRVIIVSAAVGALLLLLLLLGIVFRMRTPEGTLVVEINEADAEVLIDGQKVEIKVPGDNEPVEIEVEEGTHILTVRKGGFETRTKEFTIKSGGKETARVRLVPPAAKVVPKVAVDIERQVAEKLLNGGAKLSIYVNGQEMGTSKLSELPRSPFRIRSIAFVFGGRVPEGLGQLRQLSSIEGLNFSSFPNVDSCLEEVEGLRVEHIAISDSDISDEGLRYLSKVEGLKILSLVDTSFGKDALNSLENATGLTNLYLIGPNVTSRALEGVSNLNLADLVLKGTSVDDSGLAHLAGLQKLWTLNLDDTQVTDEGLKHLIGLKKLHNLSVVNTRVTPAGVAELQKALPECQIITERDAQRQVAERLLNAGGKLTVSLNGQYEVQVDTISQLPDGPFQICRVLFYSVDRVLWQDLKRLNSLTGLSLIGTTVVDSDLHKLEGLELISLFLDEAMITDEGVRHLSKLKGLKNLRLIDTSIGDDALSYLENVEGLSNLFLSRTKVTNGGLKRLKNLKSLAGLRLEGTAIDDSGLAHLQGMQRLWSLYLDGTEVTDEGLKHLTGLTGLRVLSLVNTRVTPAGVAELQKALPECKVITEADTERQFAERVLKAGGEVWVSLNGQVATKIDTIGQLPQEPFLVRGVQFHSVDQGLMQDLKRLTPPIHVNFYGSDVVDSDLQELEGLQLVNLSLERTKITDEGLRHLSKLASVDGLVLRDTQVTDQGLTYLENVEGLRKLVLPRTRVTSRGLEQIKNLNLVALDVSGTSVDDSGLAHLAGLENLWNLNLDDTQVTDEGLKHLTGLKKLHNLSLVNTRVTPAGVAELQKVLPECQVLTEPDTAREVAERLLNGGAILTVGVNGQNDTKVHTIAGLPESPFQIHGVRFQSVVDRVLLQDLKRLNSLPSLNFYGSDVLDSDLQELEGLQVQVLTLADTKITDAGVPHLSKIRGLKTLSLVESEVTDKAFAHFEKLKDLTALNLARTGVTSRGLERIRSLNLTSLDVSGTSVDHSGLAHLQGLEQLYGLWLDDTQVTDEGLKHLTGLAGLRELSLVNTRVTAAGVAELQSALPECKVITEADAAERPGEPARLLRTLEGHKGTVNSVAFSRDGSTLGSGSDDKTARLWDVATGESGQTLEGHPERVTSVSFHPDGLILAAGSRKDVADPTGGEAVKFWSTASGEPQPNKLADSQTHSVNSVAYSPDGSMLATGCVGALVKVWNLDTGELRHTLKGHTDVVMTVAFSPDSQALASGSGNQDKTVRLWDLATGKLRHTLEGHEDLVRSVAFSPDGSLLATGSNDGTVKLWDVAKGQVKQTLAKYETCAVSAVAFSPDGSTVAAGLQTHTVKLLDVATGECRQTLRGHTGWVFAVAFSQDGSLLASGSADNTVKLWDVSRLSRRTQEPGDRAEDPVGLLRTLQPEDREPPVKSVAFSPDGSLVAAVDNLPSIRLWEVSTGRLRRPLCTEYAIVFNPAWEFRGHEPILTFFVGNSGDTNRY